MVMDCAMWNVLELMEERRIAGNTQDTCMWLLHRLDFGIARIDCQRSINAEAVFIYTWWYWTNFNSPNTLTVGTKKAYVIEKTTNKSHFFCLRRAQAKNDMPIGLDIG